MLSRLSRRSENPHPFRLGSVKAVPQALVYMLHAPDSQQQTWGMLVNGREFVFIKLVQKENPQYCHSYALPIERPQEFHEVLSLLKYLGQIVNTEN